MFGVRKFRARHFIQAAAEREAFYGGFHGVDEIRDWQFAQLNRSWKTLTENVPYWRSMLRAGNAPAQFENWDQFQRIEPLDRIALKNNRDALIDATRAPESWGSTGGSTAEPLQLPMWKSQQAIGIENAWYARRWFGVDPADKLFLIWGHSHLLGKGLTGRVNAVKRRWKDRMLGYYRQSAYDMSDEALRRAAEALLRFKPQYVISYAAALDRFARVNKELSDAFHALKLKAAFASAESFPLADSAALIGSVLGCAVSMEYGSVETGPMAYRNPAGRFIVFWRDYLLETQPSAQLPGGRELLVTSLYPRSLPLVRYKIGDLLSPETAGQPSVLQFESVSGRCNDTIALPGGRFVHSEAFSHAVKEIASIRGFHLVQDADDRIRLAYVSAQPLPESDLQEIRRRLRIIDPALVDVELQRVEKLESTIAGKTRKIVRLPRAGSSLPQAAKH